jgi:hypothetical protein
LKKAQGDTSSLTSSLAGNDDDYEDDMDGADDEFGIGAVLQTAYPLFICMCG